MSGIPIARLLGFEVRIHLSWAIILAFIVVSVASQVESTEPTVETAVRWMIGGAVAIGFLFSALAHELGHAVAARRAGIAGGPVVVYFFGGPTTPGVVAPRPRDEIVIGLAGSVVSLGLAGLLVLVAALAAPLGGPWLAIGQIALVLGVLNLVLGAINLVPAFPLDGGRIVQGLAWARTGDPRRGTRAAARSGRIVGWFLVAFGVAVVLARNEIDGLLLSITGWFLATAGRQVERGSDLDELLDGVVVADVMDVDVSPVAAGLTLDTFAGQMLEGRVAPSLPVVRGTELVGVVGASQLRKIGPKRWAGMRAEDLMIGTDRMPRVEPETPLGRVLDELRRSGLDGMPVVGADGLAGVVTRRGVLDALREQAELRGVTLP